MKATLLLFAMIITADAYGHDLANAVFSDRTTYERFVAAADVTATRLLLKKSPDGAIAGNPSQLSSYTRGESTVVPQAEAQQLRTLFTLESSFLWHSVGRGRLSSARQTTEFCSRFGAAVEP